ncbi:MAG: hypothetical protein M3Z17_07095 [Gemmatimonadota bacterium]|nr:hypothetical protein [Gemmatimonadota bacterium]
MLNKVPQLTLAFWIIKIMATTVGETAADLLSTTLKLGTVLTSWVMAALLIVTLVFQLRSKRYVPPIYWLVVVFISVVGTLISDTLVDGMGISLVTTTIIFSAALIVVFVAWYAVEHTLSVHTIVTTGRELFYWAAILFTFSLGTSAGDLISERLGQGYLVAALLFAAGIAVIYGAYKFFHLNAVLTFWIAYILTRPLGASLGDLLTASKDDGGMNLGTIPVSAVFLVVIVVLVVHLTKEENTRLETAPTG